MIAATNKNIIAAKDANTADIMSALVLAVPGAAKNLKTFSKNFYKGNDEEFIKKIVKTVRDRVTYKKDGFQNQNIKYPGRLLQDGSGDCKSLSLFAAGAMTAAGIKNGFSFAAYRPGAPTHVYNYYYNSQGEKIPFDLCIKDLKETNILKKIDMNVNYLSEPEIGRTRAERRKARQDRKDIKRAEKEETAGMTKQQKKDYKKEGRGGKKAGFKTVALAPARFAFLEILKLNFRGLATKLEKLEKNKPGKAKDFWNRLGGNYNKLKTTIKLGATRKSFLGLPEEFTERAVNRQNRIVPYYQPKYNFRSKREQRRFINEPEIGLDPATLATSIATAAAIIKPLLALLKSNNLADGDTDELANNPDIAAEPPLGKDFSVQDPEKGAEKLSAGGAAPGGSDGGSGGGGGGAMDLLKNPIVLVGGAAALFLLLKGKSKK